MIFDTFQYTDKGGRTHNEDKNDIIKLQNGMVIAVADGLGGHAHGELASSIVIRILREKVIEPIKKNTLFSALEQANSEVFINSRGDHMKTTLSVLWLDNTGIGLTGNVGDSRIYQIRKNEIIFQSRDHSLAQFDILAGDTTYKDVRENPDRNMLIRAVGVESGFKADIERITYQSKDAFLICSDGFWENIYENEIIDARYSSSSAEDWMNRMLDIIKPRMNEKSDNNTAITLIIS